MNFHEMIGLASTEKQSIRFRGDLVSFFGNVMW